MKGGGLGISNNLNIAARLSNSNRNDLTSFEFPNILSLAACTQPLSP